MNYILIVCYYIIYYSYIFHISLFIKLYVLIVCLYNLKDLLNYKKKMLICMLVVCTVAILAQAIMTTTIKDYVQKIPKQLRNYMYYEYKLWLPTLPGELIWEYDERLNMYYISLLHDFTWKWYWDFEDEEFVLYFEINGGLAIDYISFDDMLIWYYKIENTSPRSKRRAKFYD